MLNKDIIRTELERLAAHHKGRITPEMVVQEAEDESSPLHVYFEWRDEIAGPKYRLEQARQLLRQVRIVYRIEEKRIKAPVFVRDPARSAGEQGYIALKQVRDDDDLARDIIIAEFARASAALKRARSVAKALGHEHEIVRILEKLDGLRDVVVQQRPQASA